MYKEFIRSYLLEEYPDEKFFALVSDIYFSEEVQSLAVYRQHADINRLQHITAVAYLTYCIAEKKGWNYKAAARGAVLHDLFYYDWHDSSWEHRPNGYRHPGFAAVNARILLRDGLGEIEENMILRHMWPLTLTLPKYRESFLLTFTDKYCATLEMLIARGGRFQKNFNRKRHEMKLELKKC